MTRFFPILTALLVMVFATDALAITCRGSSLWRSMPEAEKQRLIAAANRQPFAQGRYFRIEKGGRTSYILGTIHVPPIKQLKLPGYVMEQLRKSSHVYLEKSEKEFSAFTAMLKANSGYVRATGLNGLSQHFSRAEWSALQEAVTDAGWRRGSADTLRPWVILDEIEGIGCGQDSEGYLLSLDARVMRDAKKYKIPTIGLETPQIVDAHYQRLPVNTIIAMLKSLPTQRPDYPHGAVGKAVIDLLASENVVLAMLFETHVQMQYLDPRGVKLRDDFTNQKILGARNRAWMPALTRALSQGNAFVAVGAAHLGGNYGILPMLQRKGYKITRIALK